jgi:hypothetical protein
LTQTVNPRLELFFLFCLLVSAICLLTAVVLNALGRRGAAKRLLKTLGVGWALYLSIVLLVAAVTPQRAIPMDHDLCFDELCFAVVKVQTAPELGPSSQPLRAKGLFFIVTVRASSHARGRAQSEQGLRAQLWSPGHQYQVSPAGQRAWNGTHAENVQLTTRLRPGQSVLSDQVFDVDGAAEDLGLVLSNGLTPGYLVIGESPLLRKPTILRLSR